VVKQGDVRDILPTLDAGSVQCVVTSPPYWGLRDYGVEGQIGLEPTPEEYVQTMVEVFREVKRVLRDDGTLWLNMGDCFYSPKNFTGSSDKTDGVFNRRSNRLTDGPHRKTNFWAKHSLLKPKDLVGQPWRVAFALQADGWYLRSDIVWAKGVSFCPDYSGSVMPEPVTDRPTKSHEYLFLLTKSARYYYDADAVREEALGTTNRADFRVGGSYTHNNSFNNSASKLPTDTGKHRDNSSTRNLRSVWTINPQPYREAHFATFPTTLVEPCVKAGSKKGDTVLDPFAGSGTTGLVAGKLGREFVGIELNPDYIRLANERIEGPLFARAQAW
jgi:DNA modification methylase